MRTSLQIFLIYCLAFAEVSGEFDEMRVFQRLKTPLILLKLILETMPSFLSKVYLK